MRRAAVVCAILLASCGGTDSAVDQAQDAVRQALRDPGSAQFRNVEYHPENGALCGEVNAKNAYGGYVGFAEFFVANGAAHIAPSVDIVAVTDVDRLGAAVEQARFTTAKIEACESEPLRERLKQN